MKTFGEVALKDYTVQNFYASSPFQWRLVSSSVGTTAVEPDELEYAVAIYRGNGDRSKYIADSRKADIIPVSNENGLSEHIVYSSIKHIFYDNGIFYSGSVPVDTSIVELNEDIFVISIGQDFYGERVKPGSFEMSIDNLSTEIFDDSYGNLFISSSGTSHYIGNIFYNFGIAVINHNTQSTVPDVSSLGIKIIEGTNIYVNYDSEVKNTRHEIAVRLKPSDFNFSWFNPSVRRPLLINGELSEEIKKLNIPEFDENEWTIQSLMQSGVIKPYVTTIGLYNDKYELIAVAKLSTPIQRTFETEQIFIVRFDV